jgi:toluene monooxygenase system protein A
MLKREDWLPLARKLDWNFTYTTEREVFPEVISGHPWLPHASWQDWDETFKTSYREYVENQHEKDMAVYAVRDAVGRLENVQNLATPWINGLKVHAAALPLAELPAPSVIYAARDSAATARGEPWPASGHWTSSAIPRFPFC